MTGPKSHIVDIKKFARAYQVKLSRLGLDLKAFAHTIEVPERTVATWFRGARPIPKAIRLLIDALGRNVRLEAGTTYPRYRTKRTR